MTALATQPARATAAQSWHDILMCGYALTGAPGVKGHLMLAHGEWVNDIMGKKGWAKRVTDLHEELHADAEHLMPRPHRHLEA